MSGLVKGNRWVEKEFEEGSRPTKQKLIKWIDSGEVPGRVLGGEPYIYADQFALGCQPVTSDNAARMAAIDLLV